MTRKPLRRLGLRDPEIWIELSVPLLLAPYCSAAVSSPAAPPNCSSRKVPKRASGLPTLTGWINLIGMRGRGSKGWPEALARRGA